MNMDKNGKPTPYPPGKDPRVKKEPDRTGGTISGVLYSKLKPPPENTNPPASKGLSESQKAMKRYEAEREAIRVARRRKLKNERKAKHRLGEPRDD